MKENILNKVEGLIDNLLWDGRAEDEDLPQGAIEAAIKDGIITVEEIITKFETVLRSHLPGEVISPDIKEFLDYSQYCETMDILRKAAGDVSESKMHSPPHPGQIIKESYLDELNISINTLAKQLGVNPPILTRIVEGSAGVDSEMACRLSKVLNGTPEFWLGLQSSYDLWISQSTSDPVD